MRSQPHPAVTAWVAAQSRGSLYTTSVNEAELFYGISAMPEGRRRSGLAAGAEALFAEEFAGRVLVFGGAAARRYAEIVILRRQAGKPIEAFDALIAATALVAGAAVATRDIAGFEGCGLTLELVLKCLNPVPDRIESLKRGNIIDTIRRFLANLAILAFEECRERTQVLVKSQVNDA